VYGAPMVEPSDNGWEAAIDPAVPEFFMPLERRRAALGYRIRTEYRKILRGHAILALARVATVIAGVVVVNSLSWVDSLGKVTLIGAAACGVLFAVLAGLTALLGSSDHMPWWLAVVLTVFAFALMVGELILTLFGGAISHLPMVALMAWVLVSNAWWLAMFVGMVLTPALRLGRAVDSAALASKASH
jgi:hypothetical protein